jgi:pimeloyl-ACP methyl ester carboxylesterase
VVPTADVNGIRLHYERSGSGPPLLFLNGSGATLETTGFLLSPFAQRTDVVGHDQRGLGRTSIPSGPYSMADYAADALGLMDHLGWKQAAVVGISFGGMVAQELAVTAPERVVRLGLACTSAGGGGGASYPLHELASLPPQDQAAIRLPLLDTRFTAEWLADHPADRGLSEMMAARGADDAKSDEQRRGEAAQLDARSHHDVWDRLPRITCPTLVAAGRYDGIAPLANSEAIASRIPGSELRVYEGGHAFFAQDPAALPDLVDFLATG